MRGLVLTASFIVVFLATCLRVLSSDYSTEVRIWNGFQITLSGESTAGRANKLEVKELSTGRIVFQVESADLEQNHYHCCEYIHGNLYVIKMTRDYSAGSGEWTRELWRFPSEGAAQKLYEAQELDFRVSPQGNLIAVRHDKKLVFLEPSGKIVHDTDFGEMIKDIDCEKLEGPVDPRFRMWKWSKNGSEFWGSIDCLYVIPRFFRIDLPSWKLTTYRGTTTAKGVDKGWHSSDIDLDPDSRKVAFSDHPFVFDETTDEEIRKSRKKFHLFVHDLETGHVQRIATSVAKEFDPQWVDAYFLEYDDSSRKNRFRLNLDPGHATGIDCDKATPPIAKLICADEELLAKDYELSYYHQVSLSISPDVENFVRGRQAWIGRRNKCRDVRCVSKAYQERTKELGKYLSDMISKGKSSPITEEYCEEAEIYSDSTNKESLGKYHGCVQVYGSSTLSFIEFTVRFPDSKQILQARVPAAQDKNGAFNFRFVDGWGNWGKGSFTRKGGKGVLKIEEVKPTDDLSGRNVLRQYGEYALSKVKPGTCSRIKP
jgi:hypothetical protein